MKSIYYSYPYTLEEQESDKVKELLESYCLNVLYYHKGDEYNENVLLNSDLTIFALPEDSSVVADLSPGVQKELMMCFHNKKTILSYFIKDDKIVLCTTHFKKTRIIKDPDTEADVECEIIKLTETDLENDLTWLYEQAEINSDNQL